MNRYRWWVASLYGCQTCVANCNVHNWPLCRPAGWKLLCWWCHSKRRLKKERNQRVLADFVLSTWKLRCKLVWHRLLLDLANYEWLLMLYPYQYYRVFEKNLQLAGGRQLKAGSLLLKKNEMMVGVKDQEQCMVWSEMHLSYNSSRVVNLIIIRRRGILRLQLYQ